MIWKMHVSISFKWYDFWVGVFWDRAHMALYICIFPMIPIKIWVTEHAPCSSCGKPMRKAALDTGDGWYLFWLCDSHPDNDVPIDWPFVDQYISYVDLQRHGYEIV